MEKKRALIIEDNSSHSRLAKRALEKYSEFDFEVKIVDNAPEGLGLVLSNDFDIAIIDRQLNGAEGLDIVRSMRKYGKDTPVLVLTCMAGEENQIEGLKLKVDDYQTKPFSKEVLALRVDAIVARRSRAQQAEKVYVRDVMVDLTDEKVYRNGERVYLSKLEYKIFELLANNVGVDITYDEIAKRAYGVEGVKAHTIQVTMGTLRSKLNNAGVGDFEIKNLSGKGYVIR